MSLRLFGQIVARVMETLPKEFQPYLDNIVVDVEEEPSIDLLRHQGFTEEEIANGESLYGLFAPIALPTNWSGDVLDVRDSVIHELAHHFGYTERDLERFDGDPDPFRDRSTEQDN